MMIKDRKMRLQIANMKKHLKTFDKKLSYRILLFIYILETIQFDGIQTYKRCLHEP